jgi:hypothetical protein
VTITSVQLSRASSELTSVAGLIDGATDKHRTVGRNVRGAVARRKDIWGSPAAEQWTSDAEALLTTAGQLPAGLQEAAQAVRGLATTASSLAGELAGHESALASARATAQEVARRRTYADPDDADRLRSLSNQADDAAWAHRVAQMAIEQCAERWRTACRSSLGGVRQAVAVLSAVAMPPSAVAPDRRPVPTSQPSFGDAIDAGHALLGSTAVRGALHGHGLWLFTQRAGALNEMARAWVVRGYLNSTEDIRALAAGARSFATLRWRQIGPAMDASRAGTAARVAGQTERLASASDVFVNGRGFVRYAGRVVAPVSMAMDVATIAGGSQYEGARGAADQAAAAIGFGSTAVLLASSVTVAGTAVIASPVIIGAAVVGATAATVWGVGNLIYDHRQTIGNAFSSAGSAVADATRAVGSGIADGARALGSGVADGARAVGSGVADGVRSVGRVFGFGG